MPTFRRLLSFLRPYRRQNISSIVLASLAMGVTVLIPWLVGNVVNAINDGDRSAILPLVMTILGLASSGSHSQRRGAWSPARSRSRSSSTSARGSTATCSRSSSDTSTPSRPAS